MTGTDIWVGGDDYERYIGRWTRLVATSFVDWLEVPAGVDWLDVGCGTGVLTETILRQAEPPAIVGIDPSTSFVEHAGSHAPEVIPREAGARSRHASCRPVPGP
ncbi:MAG: class I SAM-dependent methyltransferase [Chloroflexota bacterium]